MNAPNPHQRSGAVPKRLFLYIALGTLIPVIAVAFTLYTVLVDRDPDEEFAVVRDYREQPQTVPERVLAIEGAEDGVRGVTITRGNIEVYDAGGQRYSISPKGSHLRRGGGSPPASPPFSIEEVDFAALPAILDAAKERSGGAKVTQITLESIDGGPKWRLAVWSEAGVVSQIYTLDGELVPAANAR